MFHCFACDQCLSLSRLSVNIYYIKKEIQVEKSIVFFFFLREKAMTQNL